MNHTKPAPPTFIERSHPDYAAEHESNPQSAIPNPQSAIPDPQSGIPDPQSPQALEQQLQDAARAIETYRQIRRPVPSERAWVREWPGLGSTRTLSKVLDGDFTGLNVAAKLPDYRGVLAALAAQRKSYAAEELYDDLGGAQEVALATLRLMHHHGKDRLILIEGGSGSGKTSALDLLTSGEASGSIYRLEADESWKSQRVAMRAMLLVLGTPEADVPAPTGERMEKLLQVLTRKGRVLLAIDEAHHVTGAVLNLFKTLLNRTECLLILAGMKTLLQKLRAASSEEAKQLIHNRLFSRVSLAGPDPEGAREFLCRRLGVPGHWKPATLHTLAAAAAHAGHWSFLRRVVDQLLTSGTADPGDAELLGAAQTAACEIA